MLHRVLLLSWRPELKLSHTAAMILKAVGTGHIYGFGVMEVTGLPSGSVYPAMRRLERDSLIRSRWEKHSIADAEQRPPGKYYKLTASGPATLEAAEKRYPLLAKLIPATVQEKAGCLQGCLWRFCAARLGWCHVDNARSGWRSGAQSFVTW